MIGIIGANGFVGSAFVRWCERNNKPFAGITRANYDELKGSEFEILVNANGNSRKPLANEQPLLDFQMSVESVVRSTLDFKFEKYVFLSSCDVYSHTATPEGNRESDEIDVSKLSRYGFHKLMAERYVQFAVEDWLVCRLAGMIGHGLKKNAVFDALNGGPMWLDPASELQFMDTEEVANSCMSLAKSASGKTYNVCGSGVVSVRQIIEWSGRSPEIKPGSPVVRYEVNNETLRTLYPVQSSGDAVRAFIESQRGS